MNSPRTLKDENELWAHLHPRLPRGHYTRVENRSTGPGTPDVHFCIRGSTGWLELKYQNRRRPDGGPAMIRTRTGFREMQQQWLTEYCTAGGRAFVVIGIQNVIYFVSGSFARELYEWTNIDFEARCLMSIGLSTPRHLIRRSFLTIIGEL